MSKKLCIFCACIGQVRGTTQSFLLAYNEIFFSPLLALALALSPAPILCFLSVYFSPSLSMSLVLALARSCMCVLPGNVCLFPCISCALRV